MPSIEQLNRWAADFIGEDDEGTEEAIDSQWYTSDPGPAMVVLAKTADHGFSVELSIKDSKVEIEVGGTEVEGTFTELPRLIVEACYGAHSNMEKSDGDDA